MNMMVTHLLLRLQELALENGEALPTSMPAADSSQHLGRRLGYIKTSMGTIHDSMDSLVPGRDLDECLLQALEKRIDELTSELSDVTHDILSTRGDKQALMEEELAIEKALFHMNLKISRFRQEQAKFQEAGSALKGC